jgi:hypothetical protein
MADFAKQGLKKTFTNEYQFAETATEKRKFRAQYRKAMRQQMQQIKRAAHDMQAKKLKQEGDLPEEPAINLSPGPYSSLEKRAMLKRPLDSALQNKLYWAKSASNKLPQSGPQRQMVQRPPNHNKVYWSAKLRQQRAKKMMLQEGDAESIAPPSLKSMLLPVMSKWADVHRASGKLTTIVNAVVKAVQSTLKDHPQTVSPAIGLEERIESAVEKKLGSVESPVKPESWALEVTPVPIHSRPPLRDITHQPSMGVVTESPAKRTFPEPDSQYTKAPTLGVITAAPNDLPGYDA